MTDPQELIPDPDKQKIVWILGAGFSRPLGAPLLRDLLSSKAATQIQDAYLGTPVTSSVQHIANIYDLGKNQSQWTNAEEFLERLDLAERSGTPRKLLLGWASRHDPVKTILTDAMLTERHLDGLRMLAAECCLFLKDLDASMERFSPYVSWAKDLKATDTAISFNYDRVVDLVEPRSGLKIPVPRDFDDPSDWPDPPTSPLVLKMHGSVDWIVENNAIRKRNDDPEAVLSCASSKEMALATPGPRKQAMVTGQGLLVPIWSKAAKELRAADAIVIVGYSMPATDAMTRQWMIDRLREAVLRAQKSLRGFVKGSSVRLPVHIVLGPNTRQRDVRRLVGLLETTHPVLWPRVWPMGAEDFLGLVGRHELLRQQTLKEQDATESD